MTCLIWNRCEVQFDYGLRQGRAKPLAKRASEFTTEKGQVIVVKQKVAETNEVRMTKGKVGHIVLECTVFVLIYHP